MTAGLHEPRALRDTDRDAPPAWLHTDSPYGELLTAAHDGTLGELVAEDTEPDAVVHALRALAVPSDYSTRGIDHVTHVPLGWLADWSGASEPERVLAESNRAVILPELHEAGRDETEDGTADVVTSRTGGWLGTTETVAVRPFGLDEDGRWTLTPAWRLAREWARQLERYPAADDEDLTEREHASVVETIVDALDLDRDERYDDDDSREWVHELAYDLVGYWGVDVSYRDVIERAERDYGWTPAED